MDTSRNHIERWPSYWAICNQAHANTMDDLEVNPLHKALLTKFRRQFDIACRMSYLMAIPQSNELDGCTIDQHFANSHILVPSKLLKMHYKQVQVGNYEDIEMDDKKLICYPAHKGQSGHQVEIKILADETGYNALSKQYRTILIDRPLVKRRPTDGEAPISLRTILAPLSPRSQLLALEAKKRRAQLITDTRLLRHHDDCANYLKCVSHKLTVALEADVKRMLTNYIILSMYLEDAARRVQAIVEKYVEKFERSLELSCISYEWLFDNIQRSIRVSVENCVLHLLQDKLMAEVQKFYAREEAILEKKFDLLIKLRLSLCELGAHSEFANFHLGDELLRLLKRLPNLQSPVEMVSCLMKVVKIINESLNQSVRLERLRGDDQLGPNGKTLHLRHRPPRPICSDDLIATFVFCIPRSRPSNLFTAIKYLEIFGSRSVDRDQASYYLATFASAVEYILNFGDSKQEHSSKPKLEKIGPVGDEISMTKAVRASTGNEDEDRLADFSQKGQSHCDALSDAWSGNADENKQLTLWVGPQSDKMRP